MSLIRWEPLRDIEDMLGRYGRSMGLPLARGMEPFNNGEWCPRVDISEKDSSYTIRAELPGVKREDVKVTLLNGVLTLEGQRRHEEEEHGRRFHRIERSYGSFVRSFTLPEAVDADHLSAHFHEGMLDIELPRIAQPETPVVEVPVS
jgi:HSP20 family protein